jgi:hypothetical protein
MLGAEHLVADAGVGDAAAVQAGPDVLHERHRAAQVDLGPLVERDEVDVDPAGRLLVPGQVGERAQPGAVDGRVGAQRVAVGAAVGVDGGDRAARLGAGHMVEDGGDRGDAHAGADQQQRGSSVFQGQVPVRLTEAQCVVGLHVVEVLFYGSDHNGG